METTQKAEDQSDERDMNAANCVASETVAPTESTAAENVLCEMKGTAPAVSAAEVTAACSDESKPKAVQETSEAEAETTYVIESSPEKQASEKTKEDSMKSPGEDVFSIEDEEEHIAEPEDEEGEAEEEEVYGEMDEDEEIYVETMDRTGTTEQSEENSYDQELSSDEYTDEDVDATPTDGSRQKNEADARTEKHKSNSPNDDEDDDDIQILTDDDEVEEEEVDDEEEEDEPEEDEPEEDEDDGVEEMEVTAPEDTIGRQIVSSYDSESSASSSSLGKSVKVKLKYRNYRRKLAAGLRKRAIKIINKRRMHVMEDSGDTLVVCSDANLSTILKPAIASPKEATEDSLTSLQVVAPSTKPQEQQQEATTIQRCVLTTTTGSSIGNQSNTKEKELKEASVVKEVEEEKTETQPVEDSREQSSNAISSSTSNGDQSHLQQPPSGADKMPTATAVEGQVSEKIADSSDDALTSVKSISATTPTVNSSCAEPGEGKAKESNNSRQQEAVTEKDTTEKDGVIPVEKDFAGKSPTTTPVEEENINEPTADDVMAGIDDFMEQNGSEELERNEQEDGFNEDLAFQMDVDEPSKSPNREEPAVEKPAEEKGKGVKANETTDVGNGKPAEESAMDLTSTTEPQQAEKDRPTAPVQGRNSWLSIVSVEGGSTPAAIQGQSTAERAGGDGEANVVDKTLIPSTPVIAVDDVVEKQKRMEQHVREASTAQVGQDKERGATQVKRETEDGGAHSDEAMDEQEVQNLSSRKPLARSSTIGESSAREAENGPSNEGDVNPTASRKRRRSLDRDSNQQSSEESVEPAKKLKMEVEANYPAHERVVNEYIESTSNNSVDAIQCHADTLVKEIANLTDLIRETEQQWNNLLHLKKVKEEVLLRLNRRKHIISFTETRLGEVSAFSNLDSSNLSNPHQPNHHHHQQRSSSVGPRPPTPPPEVEIRPASVSITTSIAGYNSHSTQNGVNHATGGKYSPISNRRNSSQAAGGSSTSGGGHQNNQNNSRRNGASSAKDTNSFVSQFNRSNNAVTMVPLSSSTTSMILNARASMNAAEIAKEKATAMHVQRQLLSKPVLSNQQQILNNLAMSASLTSRGPGGNNSGTALLNGHHGPSGSSSSLSAAAAAAAAREQQHQQELLIGRQGMRKKASSIIADYRQQHPENVPRRGRRLKHVGGSSGGNNNNGAVGMSGGTVGEGGGAISLTALPGGGKTASMRHNATDSISHRLNELLAATENSRPSSNDSSQSSSNLLSSLVSTSGAGSPQQQFLKDVLVQFAKMSQNEQSLLSNLQLLANNAALATSGPTTISTTNNTVSSPQRSPQFHAQHQQQSSLPQQLHGSLLSKTSLPEVTLHPVMNSTAHSDLLGAHNATSSSLAGANLSAVNTSSNSLLHGILTKSAASRPASASGNAANANAAAAAVNTFNSFSPTLARLLTGPERMNAGTQLASSTSPSTVTSGALANLQTAGVIGGLNLSKNNSEISITPVVGTNFQQTLLAQQQQQQQQQQQRQRHREQHLYNIDDEADDSVDRLVIDEGDDMAQQRDGISKRRVAEINENEVPQCQGCKRMEAKFVCAGCNHQWYCSRECQVSAWDDHSEVCSG